MTTVTQPLHEEHKNCCRMSSDCALSQIWSAKRHRRCSSRAWTKSMTFWRTI